MPVYGRGTAALPDQISDLRERAGWRLPVTMLAVVPEPEIVAELAAAGVDEVSFDLPHQPETDTLRRLDQLAELT